MEQVVAFVQIGGDVNLRTEIFVEMELELQVVGVLLSHFLLNLQVLVVVKHVVGALRLKPELRNRVVVVIDVFNRRKTRTLIKRVIHFFLNQVGFVVFFHIGEFLEKDWNQQAENEVVEDEDEGDAVNQSRDVHAVGFDG